MTEEPRTPEPDDTAQTEPLSSGDPLGDSPKSDAPPPSSPGVRRLTRSSSDKLIGGVAGGLGRYFGVDPILFRIAFVVRVEDIVRGRVVGIRHRLVVDQRQRILRQGVQG